MTEAGVLGEDERIELIEGELVVMAAKGYAHEKVRHALTELLSDARPQGIRVAAEPTLQFSDQVIVEPDIVVFPHTAYARTEAGYVRLAQGSILLVVEIAISSLGHDKDVKAGLYAHHGVHEYWVIDANARTTWVHTQPTADGWSSVVERGPNDTLATSTLPGLAIKLGEIE